MAGTVPSTQSTSSSVRSGGGGLRITRWVLTIVGGIAAFLGVFILIGGEDQCSSTRSSGSRTSPWATA